MTLTEKNSQQETIPLTYSNQLHYIKGPANISAPHHSTVYIIYYSTLHISVHYILLYITSLGPTRTITRNRASSFCVSGFLTRYAESSRSIWEGETVCGLDLCVSKLSPPRSCCGIFIFIFIFPPPSGDRGSFVPLWRCCLCCRTC